MANTKFTPEQALRIFKEANPKLSKVEVFQSSPSGTYYEVRVHGVSESLRFPKAMGYVYSVIACFVGTPKQHTSILVEME